MTQNTILAAAQTVATSTDVAIASGATVTIGLFTDRTDGVVPGSYEYWLYVDTPGGDSKVLDLGKVKGYAVAVAAPGTYRVTRPLITDSLVNVGVFSET